MSEEYKERPVTDDEVTSVITELSTADAYGFGDRVSAGQALRRAVDLIERLAEARRPAQAPLADDELARRPTDEEIERWITDCCDATRGGSAKHYWVFDVQRDDVCDIARARAALAAEADGPAVSESREPASVIGEPSDEVLLGIAAQSMNVYGGIRPGEYEEDNSCAIEVYGSELIAFARAALARWGASRTPFP